MVSSTWRIGHTICAFLTTSQSHTTCSLKSKPTLLRLLVSLQRHPTGLIRRHDNGERITVLEVQIDQLLRALVCLAIARLSYPTAESTPPDSSPRRQTAGCRRRRHLSHRSPPDPTRFIAWLHQRQQEIHASQLRNVFLRVISQRNAHRLP